MENMSSAPEKRGLWGVATLLGMLLVVFVAVMIVQQGYSFVQAVKGKKPDNTIAVSGLGKVKAVPDTAIVTLGVIAQGKDAKEAQNMAVDKINKITAFVKSLGIAKEDITTTQASINPRYNYESGQSKIVGFDSNQNVTVKVRGVDKSADVVGKLMAGAVDNGANQVYGSQFTIDDPDALQQEARKAAIVKAKEKAEELAKAAGIKLGKVVSVQETANGYIPTPMYYADKAMGIGGGGTEPAMAPNVEPGSQEVTQSVTLVFEVK